VTRITEGRVPDEVYELARSQFNEAELVNLTLATVAINAANRLNIAFRTVPGSPGAVRSDGCRVGDPGAAQSERARTRRKSAAAIRLRDAFHAGK
jgi:hypothetical protein